MPKSAWAKPRSRYSDQPSGKSTTRRSCTASDYGRHQADAQQALARHVQPVHRLRGPQQEAAKQRRTQHHLHASLQTVAQAVRAGNTGLAALEAHSMESLRAKGW